MGIKKNFIYNLLLTLCNYLFPLITYPYVSRILGVTNIGTCNFVDGIINYFILFSYLGVGSYGVREIARCGNNKEYRNYVFSNLFTINLTTTLLALFTLWICVFYIESLGIYKNFLAIGSLKIVFNLFLVEWFFQGIEEFRYITIRSVIVRLLYVAMVFTFINTKEDTLIYYLLTILTVIANSLLNWNYRKKFVHLSFKNISWRIFIIPVLIFGFYRILTSMYSSLNTVFLGFSAGTTQVGYFTTATKLYAIIMGVFTAFTTVMVPRVSALLVQNKKEELKKIAGQTFELLTIVSLPVIIFSEFYASEIIYLIAGHGYEGANLPFRIVIPLMFVIGLEQIIIQQFLMACLSNKPVLMVSLVGAAIGIILNILLIPSYKSVGASLAWVFSEISVLICGIILLNKYIGIKLPYRLILKKIFWGLLYVLISFFSFLIFSPFHSFLVDIFFYMIVFFMINLKLDRNDILYNILNHIKKYKLKS